MVWLRWQWCPSQEQRGDRLPWCGCGRVGEVTRCVPAAPEGGAAFPRDGEAGSDSWAGDVACSQHLRAVCSVVREWEDSWA